jgi:hypothetical protein
LRHCQQYQPQHRGKKKTAKHAEPGTAKGNVRYSSSHELLLK